MAKLFYDSQDGKVVNSDALTNSIQILQAKAEFESPIIQLSLRVATSNDKNVIYYDLTDEKKVGYIEISKDGWSIVCDRRYCFLRFNQTAQVEPKKNANDLILDRFLTLTNVRDEQNRLLLKVYIISMFIPRLPIPFYYSMEKKEALNLPYRL